MSHEIGGNIAGTHHSLDLSVVLQLQDNVRKSRLGVLAPDIDLRVRVVESDLQTPGLD